METAEVVLGTYENHLIGYRITQNFDKAFVLETSFTDDSHRGALRCIAISSAGVLASSSTDDSIRLHNLQKRREIGALFEHSGTVNSMVFFDKKYMFSASEDGHVCLWQTKNWELMRTLKGHKAHVMGVAVHPSGKLGLSIGSDRSFITWDLLTGKLAFQRKLAEVAQKVFFTLSGDHYLIVFNKRIDVCSLSDTKVVKDFSIEWRINCVCHIQENIFAVGGEDKHILIIDALSGKTVMTLDASKPGRNEFCSRVRCICSVGDEKNKLLFVATANGDIKIFKLHLSKAQFDVVLYGETKVRVTSMGVYSRKEAKQPTDGSKSLKQVVGEEADDQSEGIRDADCGDDEEEKDDASPEDCSSVKPRKRKAQKEPLMQKKKKKKEIAINKDTEFQHVNQREDRQGTSNGKTKKLKQKRKTK